MNLDTLQDRSEALYEELSREYYLTGSGLKADPEFQSIYDRYSDLVTDEALATARASNSAPLFEWAVDLRLGRFVARFEEQQLLWEQEATVQVNGATVPYLRVPIELANSPDRDYRIALDEARVEAGAAGLDGVRAERFAAEREALDALGMGDYVDTVGALGGIDLDALGAQAARFLEQSAPIYDDSLARLAKRRIGVPLGDLVRADSPWLFRADQFDGAFPPDRLVEAASGQMGEMGLDATRGGRVRFDTEERDGKQPRAFCAPVRVPEEVYVVLRPRGGHTDYRTFWHELGHAMHFASADPGLPFAARCAGDNSVTEGFAMLWDHVTLDTGWLKRYGGLGAEDARDLAFELAVAELFLLRRYAAKMVYELEFHRDDPAYMGLRYVELLSDATRFRYLEGDHLLDVDPGFYVARYLRAWQLEASFANTLVERFDDDWYRNPRAGSVVQELMGRGQGDPANQLESEYTGGALTFDQITPRLESVLS